MDTPPTEADLAELASAIHARQRQLRSQVTDVWEARERSRAAQVADLIKLTRAQTQIILPGSGPARPPRKPELPQKPQLPEKPEKRE